MRRTSGSALRPQWLRPSGPQGEKMTNGTQPIIKLDGVTKVFFTDEVETHALDGI